MTPREVAAEHAARRRARLSRIRQTVAAVSVCLFIALFSGIYVQMALGHDPALGKKAAVTHKATNTANSGASSSGSAKDSSSSSSSDSGSTSSDNGSTASQPSPVTTSQS
jgi:hypothetical protein